MAAGRKDPSALKQKYRRLLGGTALFILIAVPWAGIYFIAKDENLSEAAKASWSVPAAVLVNLASMIIAFLIVSLLFSREDEDELRTMLMRVVDESIGTPVLLSQIPWSDLIDNSSEIDFVVQGWDGWADSEPINRALTAFFERGGRFRLYLCNPESREGTIARDLMAKRLGRSPGGVVEEIKGTSRTISEVRAQVATASQGPEIEVIQTNAVNWYFAAYFKGKQNSGERQTRDVIVFSVYSHTKWRPWWMPAVVIYPDMHTDVKMLDWFKAELNYLRSGVPQGAPDAASPSVSEAN